MFDELVKKFLWSYPEATVIEIGSLKSRLSLPPRTTIRVFRKLFPKVYQLSLFAGQSPC